ncbi:MAG TPA: 50S ribosomal protein L13 [Candidatus Levybacteria bacterium]|nr:50S ribosomal protein L13 [Candidatus Levybacteria bacterium]
MILKTTTPTKAQDITRVWHHVDLKDQTLGRTATKIAELLMGKNKSYFVRNLDCGDYVVVTNAKDFITTGNKEKLKVYTNYSGYPGGLRKETLGKLKARKPEEVIRHAVSGMLPKNKLRDKMLKRLHVYTDESHPYEEKFVKKGESK